MDKNKLVAHLNSNEHALETMEKLREYKEKCERLEEIIKDHELNVMPLEIESLKKSLKQEKRNVLDLSGKLKTAMTKNEQLKKSRSIQYKHSLNRYNYIKKLENENEQLKQDTLLGEENKRFEEKSELDKVYDLACELDYNTVLDYFEHAIEWYKEEKGE